MAGVPGPEFILNAGRKIPEVKWPLFAGAILAIPAIAWAWYKYDIRVAGLCFVVMLFLMTITKIFAKVGESRSGVSLRWQIWFFSWFCLILFVAVSVALFSSIFFGVPKLDWSFVAQKSAQAGTVPEQNNEPAASPEREPQPSEPSSEVAHPADSTKDSPQNAENNKPDTAVPSNTPSHAEEPKNESEVVDADFDQAALAREKEGDHDAFGAICDMINGQMVLNGRTRNAENTPEQEEERVRSDFRQARWTFEAATKAWTLSLGDSTDPQRKARLESKLKTDVGITCIQKKLNKAPNSTFIESVACHANGTPYHVAHLWDGQEFPVEITMLHNY